MIAIGFEPMTVCLEGRCSIQLSYATRNQNVGVAGFEPAASTSQTWRDNRATLHPENDFLKIAERKGFEPPVPVKVQLLSREPRSTTLAPLQCLFLKELLFSGCKCNITIEISQDFFHFYSGYSIRR